MSTDPTQPDEIEISLEDETELELTKIDIDSDALPLEFSVDGVIRNIDTDVLDELKGRELKPVAVRLQLLSADE